MAKNKPYEPQVSKFVRAVENVEIQFTLPSLENLLTSSEELLIATQKERQGKELSVENAEAQTLLLESWTELGVTLNFLENEYTDTIKNAELRAASLNREVNEALEELQKVAKGEEWLEVGLNSRKKVREALGQKKETST